MFTEAQNLAITRTELDTVFFQEFAYDQTNPGIATARTAELFKPLNIETSAYIEQVYKGSPLFSKIGETATVPLSTPAAANKLTTSVVDFAQGIDFMCRSAVMLAKYLVNSVELLPRTIPSQAF